MNIHQSNNKGFTLIELMIVVVIIGILAAMAIPRFMEASTKTKQAEPAGAASAAAPQAFSELWIEIMNNCRYSFTIVANNNSFTCTATGNIDDDPTIDTWTIDNTGELINTITDVGA